MDAAQSGFGWKTSSFSGGNDQCVEVAARDGHVAVRNSKRREGSRVEFTPEEWDAFIRGVKAGEFDL